MANSSTPQVWNLQMGYGSLQEWLFTFTYPSTGALYPISGHTWEYVVRTSGTGTGTPLISITTVANAQGLLTVDTTASTVQLSMYPPATSSLAPGEYVHSLWMDPGDTVNAFTWLNGNLVIAGNPQP